MEIQTSVFQITTPIFYCNFLANTFTKNIEVLNSQLKRVVFELFNFLY